MCICAAILLCTLCGGALPQDQAPPAKPERARELLEQAIRKQLHGLPETRPVHSFRGQIQMIDQSEGNNRQATLEIWYEASPRTRRFDKILTCLLEGNYVKTAYDGKRYWIWDRKSRRTRLMSYEFEKDKLELKRRARMCRTLTHVFSLQGLREGLQNLQLEGENLEVLAPSGSPQKMAFILRATSREIGRLLAGEARGTSSGDAPAPKPSPGKDQSIPEQEIAQVRLLFEKKGLRLARIEVRPLGSQGESDWQTYDFPSYRPFLVLDSGQRILGPAGFRVYSGRAIRGQPAPRLVLIARIRSFELNPTFPEGAFKPR